MPTDDERREVARNIRENYVCGGLGYKVASAYNIAMAIGMNPGILVGDIELWNRLADLIEPSEPQVKRELKYRSRCDELGAEMKRQRDALLKLADEMETADPEDLNVAIDYITECASRISEAFGA